MIVTISISTRMSIMTLSSATTVVIATGMISIADAVRVQKARSLRCRVQVLTLVLVLSWGLFAFHVVRT